MSSKTTNYNLHKIDLTDAPPDITVLNQNWDIIDEELHDIESNVQNKVNDHANKKDNPHGVTAAQAGALPTDGGTMSGAIEFKQAENGYGRMAKNHNSTADYGVTITDVNASGQSVKLVLSATDNGVKLTTRDNVVNKLYGEHNKADVRDAVLSYGTDDITAGTTGLTTGKLYLVYE
jgi:hypothetical protein